jgi:hypothetical protein
MLKKPGYKSSGGTFVKRELFESKAFLALKGAASQVLIIFLGKRQMRYVNLGKEKKWVCENEGTISFTYIEAKKKYGITKSRFSRAIGELLAKGFISIKHAGGCYQQDKSVYALSDEWKFWSPGNVINKREKETVKRGFCKPKREKVTSKTVPINSHVNEPQRMVLQ